MNSNVVVGVANRLPMILPLPAGEGWGEGESFEQKPHSRTWKDLIFINHDSNYIPSMGETP
jgi:hypothetical protein